MIRMFSGWILPAPEPITPVGMQVLMIFLGLVWLWSCCGMLWPSLLGMISLALSGAMPLSQFTTMRTAIVFISLV